MNDKHESQMQWLMTHSYHYNVTTWHTHDDGHSDASKIPCTSL